ncbi:MAG: hypothetical protein HY318_13640 [Armatimonadetes bacterium]|nr:hypothetical protein [Armatimonadota bacterium]
MDKGYIVEVPKARGGKEILFPGNDNGAWVLGWPTVKDLTATKILKARVNMRASAKPAPGALIRFGLYSVDAKRELAHPFKWSYFNEGAYTWIHADQFDFPAQGRTLHDRDRKAHAPGPDFPGGYPISVRLRVPTLV